VKIATAQQEQAVAGYGSVVLTAFREVENALANQAFLAERGHFEQGALADNTEAVRLGELKYKAGAIDLLSVLQFQTAQLASQAEIIKLRNAQLANRITLHLALGGSFDPTPAIAAPGSR
jgi:multidrug efflux system outer membrane protein